MLDRHAEFNKHAQRRLAEHLKPIHFLLVDWSPEARYDGAPRWPVETILSRIIEQTALGASQSGATPSQTVPPRIEFADWMVASQRAIVRQVLFTEYVNCINWPMSDKLRWLLRHRKIRMSDTAYNRNLNTAREGCHVLCRTYGRMLHIDIV